MRNKILFLLLMCFFKNTVCQINLVPNPSFEIDTACPTNSGEIGKALPWKGTNGSSELFKNCGGSSLLGVPSNASGSQYAKTGKAYAGQWSFQYFGINYREYIQSPLSESLTANSCYLVKFYVNKANNLKLACNNHGAVLTTNSFTSPTVQPPTPAPMVNYTPQILSYDNKIVTDTLRWVEIGAVFKAIGGEKYITIGNFKSDQLTDTISYGGYAYNMSYYYYDDVSVVEISDTKKWIRDTTIHRGDSVFIGSNLGGITATWYNTAGQVLANKPGLFVKPSIDTKYIVHQTFCGGTYIDTLLVQIIEDHVGFPTIAALGLQKSELFPNPNNGELKIRFNKLEGSQKVTLQICSMDGRLLENENKLIEAKIAYTFKYDLINGLYQLKIIYMDGSFDIHPLLISN